MLRFAQHDNRGVITCHAERSKAESKHLSPPMPNVRWITVVYLATDKPRQGRQQVLLHRLAPTLETRSKLRFICEPVC